MKETVFHGLLLTGRGWLDGDARPFVGLDHTALALRIWTSRNEKDAQCSGVVSRLTGFLCTGASMYPITGDHERLRFT